MCMYLHAHRHISQHLHLYAHMQEPVPCKPIAMHLHMHLYPYAWIKTCTQSCVLACVSACARVGSLHGTHRSASEGNRATKLGEQGLPRPSTPESHFLESVSDGVSESELGAGPSGGTGRRGGCVGKAEAPNLSFKVSSRGRRSL